MHQVEETKAIQETRKIFGDPELRVFVTCVRVPVLRTHCVAIHFECEKPIGAQEVRDLVESAAGVRLVDDRENNYFPMPKDACGCSNACPALFQKRACRPLVEPWHGNGDGRSGSRRGDSITECATASSRFQKAEWEEPE